MDHTHDHEWFDETEDKIKGKGIEWSTPPVPVRKPAAKDDGLEKEKSNKENAKDEAANAAVIVKKDDAPKALM